MSAQPHRRKRNDERNKTYTIYGDHNNVFHAAEINMPLEFNLLGYKAMRHYPSQPFIDLCKKHHNRIIIGTDAHDAGALKDTKTYNRAYTYLKENGLEITEDIKMLK